MGNPKKPGLDLGKHVEDKELFDRNGRRAGKVDDLLLELPDVEDSGDAGDAVDEPEVIAIISGPLAMARNLPAPFLAFARGVYGLFGVRDPKPIEIPWGRVKAIEVVVHVEIDRDEFGLTSLADAVDRKVIGRIPGAGVKP